jgi:hypothetical protein
MDKWFLYCICFLNAVSKTYHWSSRKLIICYFLQVFPHIGLHHTRRTRGDQCGIEFPAARSFSNVNTGQPKACRCFILLPTLIELKCSSLEVPSSKTGKML